MAVARTLLAAAANAATAAAADVNGATAARQHKEIKELVKTKAALSHRRTLASPPTTQNHQEY